MKKFLKMVGLSFALALLASVGLKSNAYANQVVGCVCFTGGGEMSDYSGVVTADECEYANGVENAASGGGCWS